MWGSVENAFDGLNILKLYFTGLPCTKNVIKLKGNDYYRLKGLWWVQYIDYLYVLNVNRSVQKY